VHLVPEILAHHEKVLPMLAESLNDSNPNIVMKACYALESFAEPLGL